jgi:hypothetical protein
MVTWPTDILPPVVALAEIQAHFSLSTKDPLPIRRSKVKLEVEVLLKAMSVIPIWFLYLTSTRLAYRTKEESRNPAVYHHQCPTFHRRAFLRTISTDLVDVFYWPTEVEDAVSAFGLVDHVAVKRHCGVYWDIFGEGPCDVISVGSRRCLRGNQILRTVYVDRKHIVAGDKRISRE